MLLHWLFLAKHYRGRRPGVEDASFSVRLEELYGTPIIKVEGELCLHTKDRFDAALEDAKRHATGNGASLLVVVDFSNLGFVDTEGLRVVIQHMNDLEELSGELRLAVDHNGPAAVLLDASHKQGLFPLYNTAEDAVNNDAPMGWYTGG